MRPCGGGLGRPIEFCALASVSDRAIREAADARAEKTRAAEPSSWALSSKTMLMPKPIRVSAG
jgi:hypothetical protein